MQNVIKKFLQLNKYYSHQKDFEDYFLSHPNYPSLYAVTDTFTLIGIDNVAAKVSKEQFFELPKSFLTLVYDELVLVEKKQDYVVVNYDKFKAKRIITNDFLASWDGIVVAIDTNEKKQLYKKKNPIKVLVFSVLIVFFIINSYFNETLNFYTLSGFVLMCIGLFVSILIIEANFQSYDQNSFSSKICSFNDYLSCDNMIQSNQAIIFKGLNFSDLPIIFFGTSILALLLNTNSIFLIGFFSLFALPVVIYSIWVQQRELKRWCFLCLTISLLIISLSLFCFYFFDKLNWNSLLLLNGLITVVTFIWFNYRNLLDKNSEIITTNRQLFNFKRNPTTFNFLVKRILYLEFSQNL